MLAQVLDQVSNGSGWFGASLLGGVLSWLMFKHLPAKDKQLSELVLFHEGQMTAALKSSRDDFRESLQLVIGHCQRETAQLTEAFRHDVALLAAKVDAATAGARPP